jgi:hypothetical protein
LGYHPIFQLARSAYRVIERPYFLGGAAELLGFVVGRLQEVEPSIDRQVVDFLRREQIGRLKGSLIGRGEMNSTVDQGCPERRVRPDD